MNDLPAPWTEPDWQKHTQLLLDSYRHWLGTDLIERTGIPQDEALRLFESSWVVVAHGTEDDPRLNYANREALALWETDLTTLIGMPSRLTAEPMHRDERARMLAASARDGFIRNYRGVRISTTGRRFQSERAVVWNLVDADGSTAGQAAAFREWTWL